MTTTPTSTFALPLDDIHRHWQGHRGLTRRVIEAFPEDALFTHSVGGMRPFGDMTMELVAMSHDGVVGLATATWPDASQAFGAKPPTTKAELLALWDRATAQIDQYWPTITSGRLTEQDKAFGMWPGSVYSLLLYSIDNEIHHRGQGYVYLRSLGIEPPPFWER